MYQNHSIENDFSEAQKAEIKRLWDELNSKDPEEIKRLAREALAGSPQLHYLVQLMAERLLADATDEPAS
jgi:hypothetical protein